MSPVLLVIVLLVVFYGCQSKPDIGEPTSTLTITEASLNAVFRNDVTALRKEVKVLQESLKKLRFEVDNPQRFKVGDKVGSYVVHEIKIGLEVSDTATGVIISNQTLEFVYGEYYQRNYTLISCKNNEIKEVSEAELIEISKVK